jgi:hypothetical protein
VTTLLNFLQVVALAALVYAVVQQVRWTKRLIVEYEDVRALQTEMLEAIMKRGDSE